MDIQSGKLAPQLVQQFAGKDTKHSVELLAAEPREPLRYNTEFDIPLRVAE